MLHSFREKNIVKSVWKKFISAAFSIVKGIDKKLKLKYHNLCPIGQKLGIIYSINYKMYAI